MDNCVFVLVVLLFFCVVATLRAHADDLDQIWTCDEVFNAWQPALGLVNNDLINRTVVQYKKPPITTSAHFGIESITVSLLRHDTYFDCRVELKERNRFVHTVIHVEKHDFCSNDYCEINFEDLGFGYYCIQMKVRLANDSDAFDGNTTSHCESIYMNEAFKIDPGNLNASTAVLLAKTGRRYAAMSSMSTTWFVVGGLAVIGVFLAFALDKAHRRRHKHQYASVIDSSRPTSIKMEVMSPSNTSSGQLRMAKEMTGRLLVLYAYDSHAQFLLVKHLVDLLKHTLLNWEVIFYEEHSKEIGSDGLAKWVRDEVYAADRIILVGSEKTRRSHLSLNANIGHGDVNSVFSIAWNCILSDEKLRGNYAKIFNVRFDGGGSGSRDSSSAPLISGWNFVLPVDYVRLINHVLGNNLMSEAFCRDLKQRVDEFQSYQLLEAAVEWMSADLRHNRRDLTPPIGRSHDLSWILNG